jgi:hypothetical protein
LGGRGRQIFEFEASLVYKVSSRTARATQGNPVSKKKKKKKTKKKGKKRVLGQEGLIAFTVSKAMLQVQCEHIKPGNKPKGQPVTLKVSLSDLMCLCVYLLVGKTRVAMPRIVQSEKECV